MSQLTIKVAVILERQLPGGGIWPERPSSCQRPSIDKRQLLLEADVYSLRFSALPMTRHGRYWRLI